MSELKVERKWQVMFEYRDSLSWPNWNKQRCTVFAIDALSAKGAAFQLYGLGECEYHWLEVKPVEPLGDWEDNKN